MRATNHTPSVKHLHAVHDFLTYSASPPVTMMTFSSSSLFFSSSSPRSNSSFVDLPIVGVECVEHCCEGSLLRSMVELDLLDSLLPQALEVIRLLLGGFLPELGKEVDRSQYPWLNASHVLLQFLHLCNQECLKCWINSVTSPISFRICGS